MSMYLMKDDTLLGSIHESAHGWHFLPNLSGRRASRKGWPTANAAIPAWAMRLSTALLTAEEWKERQSDR